MTAKERDILDQLRSDVHSYHSEVKGHIATCEPYFRNVDQHNTDLYGNPQDREGNPGLLSQVADLKKSRWLIRAGIGAGWTVATILLGALASRWF